MIDPRVSEWIKGKLSQGYPAQQLHDYLINKGYPLNDISEVFENINKPAAAESPEQDSSHFNAVFFASIAILCFVICVGIFIFISLKPDLLDILPLPDKYPTYSKEELSSMGGSFVNRNEIGGEDLRIYSTMDISRPLNSSVDDDGLFTAEFSDESVQFVPVVDSNNQAKGSGISLPEYDNSIIIDAHSSGLVIIFSYQGILMMEPVEAKRRIEIIENMPCFQELVTYIRKELPDKQLTDFLDYPLDNCIEKIRDKIKAS